MFSKFLICLLLIAGQLNAHAQDDKIFEKARKLYSEGRYEATAEELNGLESQLKGHEAGKESLAMLAYWQAIVANRLNDFPKAIQSFDKAIKLGFDSPDINYEFGQALFAAENMKRARAQFAKSYKKKYKKAVSVYYIAYISKEIGEYKKAYKYFKLIEKMPSTDSAEVMQASRMQIGDMYLRKAEDHPDEFRVVENHVIPQYEKALEVDKDSALAPIITDKIQTLQKKYDLLLFQLRNGRPVLRPPYFLKISQELGYDSNVLFSPTETTIDKSKQHSHFTRTDIFGRYTFYYLDYLSFSPEFRFNNTYHFNREPEIYRNDNRVFAGALRNSYEYVLAGRPAAILMDVDYNEVQRDIRQRKRLQFNSSSMSYMLGTRVNFWDKGETVFRFRHRTFDSYNDIFDSKTISASVEQIVSFTLDTLLIYASIDRTRVEFDLFDTNSFTVRADYILSRFREWATPIVGVGITRIDPVNDRGARGVETLINPSARIIKSVGKNWRTILKYERQKYDSQDTLLFGYRKEVYGLELEYLF